MGVEQAKEYRTDRAEQLSLLSSEELAELQCPSCCFPREGEVQPPDTTEARRARLTKSEAIQDKLPPGF